MADGTSGWRRCSACKKPIDFGAVYWTCSVSTCNRARTALQFCTVSCWEVHLPVARHRESWAEEQRAPGRGQAQRAESSARPSRSTDVASREPRRIIAENRGPQPARPKGPPREVLIIASRLKDYVRAVSGFNCSDRVLDPLSDIVREACEQAIRSAREEGRRTILDRDVPKR